MKIRILSLWFVFFGLHSLTYGTIEDPYARHQGSVGTPSYTSFPYQASTYNSDEESDTHHDNTPLADLTHLLPSPPQSASTPPEENWAEKILSCFCWPCENSDEF